MTDFATTIDLGRRGPVWRAPRFVLRRPERILLPLLIMAVLAGWHFLVVLGGIDPLILPRPWTVVTSLISGFTEKDYLQHLAVTGYETLVGFLIASGLGLIVGSAIALSPLVARVLYPYLVAIQTVPKIALAPLLIIWFGFGEASKIAVAAIIAFFPMVANVVAGLRECDEGKLDVLRSLGASRWQILRMVRLPNALPFVFNGLNIAIVFALTGAIVGEFVGASAGMGFLMVQANGLMDVPMSFSVMLVLGVFGAGLFGGIKLLRRRIVYWAPEDRITSL